MQTTTRWLFVLMTCLGLMACRSTRTTGAQCMFNGECDNGLICAGQFCRAVCATDRDCPANSRCVVSDQPNKTACVPIGSDQLCSDRSQCGPNRICAADGRCRLVCTTNADCTSVAPSSVCNLPAGTCSQPDTVSGDAGVDAGMDAGTDAGMDTGNDVANDTFVEDTSEDVGRDVPMDNGAADAGCVNATCFQSTGSEGPLELREAGVVTIAAGVHNYTTITIASGVRVVTNGDGVLDLRATGDVLIDGNIDVSGGAGVSGVYSGSCGANSPSSGGGNTGFSGNGAACNGGSGGRGTAGGAGNGGCALGGMFGGGAGSAGGANNPAAGGGGYAGGGGGVYSGTIDQTFGGAGGGIGGGEGGAYVTGMGFLGGKGGESTNTSVDPVYRGVSAGNSRCTPGTAGTDFFGSGGGGGSIGREAAADLAVSTTFRPGSGGGGAGGGAGYTGGCNRGGAGGGGGGAIRIVSPTSIVVSNTGSILANGGSGGNGGGTVGVSGGGSATGGGGSGGAIVLMAPTLNVVGRVQAAGGPAGAPGPACGMGTSVGGAGGMGRIRLSVNPSQCTFNRPSVPTALPAGDCTPSAPMAGRVYIGVYPN